VPLHFSQELLLLELDIVYEAKQVIWLVIAVEMVLLLFHNQFIFQRLISYAIFFRNVPKHTLLML
jgi:hypothetical protein